MRVLEFGGPLGLLLLMASLASSSRLFPTPPSLFQFPQIPITSTPSQTEIRIAPLPYKLVHEFPLPFYMEGIYVLSNGDILVTTVAPSASIWHLSAVTTKKPVITRVLEFENINVASAITGTQRPDVFVFVGGNQTTIGKGIDHTYSVFELDISRGLDRPIITERVRMTRAKFCVHIEPLPGHPDQYLVSDTKAGAIWKVDALAGTHELAVQDDAMKPPPWAPIKFGIGNAHVRDGYVYWNNGFLGTIYRIKITDEGYAAEGAQRELVNALRAVYIDGMTFGPLQRDIMWVASNSNNQLLAVSLHGGVTTVLGSSDDAELAGPVNVAFGKLVGDTQTLYVITCGALINPINGSYVEGGKIIAVDTSGFTFPSLDDEL
ncbi:hypothetical protein FHL15_007047 [Xylaria flabelliformis]|uniref:SMP-30/Gluconolactonase/LRE-like region domain-containing protein n=1 Tax=Xylaria flabelliformis TaxID=2512241 RepID=A0A553HW67_9PEZI|nr:hypothetical protein FHL15_007047 [Xylaria flabelliformis]